MSNPVLRGLAVTTTALALAVPAAAPTSAAAVRVIETVTPSGGVLGMTGSGWGHGRGMSQWGAYQAAAEGRTHAEILAFYYPGTALQARKEARVRVLLTGYTGRNLIVRANRGLTATTAGDADTSLLVRPARCRTKVTRWRARAVGTQIKLSAYCRRWRTVARISDPSVTFSRGSKLVRIKSGSLRRGYRGGVTATVTGPRSLSVVNTVPMEQYLRPVVAAEVSSSWPSEALRAQAVAARSYAAHEALGRGGSFDVYDSTRSQAYPGAVEYAKRWKVVRYREHERTDAAIADTAGVHVTWQGAPALTQFSSSNGGATAASPLPYMVAAADGWDARASRNPRLTWTDSVSLASLDRRYPAAGGIRRVEVLGREGFGPFGGRITALRLVGAARSFELSTDGAIRAALGVNSSMFTFTG
jgi:SpoIID/LytB domain protein